MQHYLSPVARDKIFLPEYDSDVPCVSGVYSASDGSPDFNNLSDLNDSIFSWESYECLAQFCGKLGINFRDNKERKEFLNIIRSQHSLPPVDLDINRHLIDLFGGLSF